MTLKKIAAAAAVACALAPVAATAPPAVAGYGQGSASELVINPGGGQRADASDGVRFTINRRSSANGQDDLVYRGSTQWCCSAGSPMLNVGGTLVGQTGPANQAQDWASVTPVTTSGSAVETPTNTVTTSATTGSGSARMRYVARVGGLDYTVDRTVSYTYPNLYVDDAYTFTIPAGNTAPVKFYLGGDAAPGGVDRGYGVMLTAPVRSVISLNRSAGILFGFREVAGSKPFDGATSQSYRVPYTTVETGGDIGFVREASDHDAGLMVQWDLGSTPGTQTAALQQFANPQGTNLTAAFDRSRAVDGTARLDLQVANTLADPATGLGLTLRLPAEVAVAGPATSSCGGSVTAAEGGDQVVLASGAVPVEASCLVSVPVRLLRAGAFSLGPAAFSGVAGMVNLVGTSALTADRAADPLTRTRQPEPEPRVGPEPRVVPEPEPESGPTCLGRAATVVAQPGVATYGTDGDDVIVGTEGDDTIHAGGGDDLVCALGGRDLVRAGTGDDRLVGGAGADRLRGSLGGDLLLGGVGDDELRAGQGADVLKGGRGDDALRGRGGDDVLRGGAGGDRLRGGGGPDETTGGTGENVLHPRG